MTTAERIINNIRNNTKMSPLAYSSRTVNKALKDQSLTDSERVKLSEFLTEVKAEEAKQPPMTVPIKERQKPAKSGKPDWLGRPMYIKI